MAELHGRILRLPDRGKLALLALGMLLSVPWGGTARAQSVTEEELATLAGRLSSPYEDVREEALQRLRTLPESALPAIGDRVARLGRLTVPAEDALAAVFAFRHATGSRRADDRVDIAPGIAPVLAERRDRSTVRMAERLALLRALERLGTPRATRSILDVMALDPGAWRWESALIVARLGGRMLPAIVEGRVHASPDIRRWSRETLEDLGMTSPGRAIQQADPTVLADLLRAYGASLDFDAMEVVAPFVGHENPTLREAAREAMERFGRNGIWQLRTVMRNQLGREADPTWGWQRTTAELYAGIDAARLGPAHAALDAGLAAFAEGDLATMRRHYEAVLLDHPMLERRREMGPGFAALAAERLAAGDVEAAPALLRRALALAPDAPDARRWEAELRWLAHRPELARGLGDVEELRAIVALDPAHALAAEALAELVPETAVDGTGASGSARGALAVVLATLGVLLLVGPRLRPPAARAVEGVRVAAYAVLRALAERRARAGRADPLPPPGGALDELDYQPSADDDLDAFVFGEEPADRVIHLDAQTPPVDAHDAAEAVIDADDPDLDLDALFRDPMPTAFAVDAADTVPGTVFAPGPS